jgi:hypothetical protein
LIPLERLTPKQIQAWPKTDRSAHEVDEAIILTVKSSAARADSAGKNVEIRSTKGITCFIRVPLYTFRSRTMGAGVDFASRLPGEMPIEAVGPFETSFRAG